MSFILKTPQDIQQELAERFKSRRLALRFTRDGLAKRAGVSASSLKRFETTGQISLQSLLKLALVLDCLDDFQNIATNTHANVSLDDILKEKKLPKKGTIK